MNLRPAALASALGLAGALTSPTSPTPPTPPLAPTSPITPTSPVPAAALSGLSAPTLSPRPPHSPGSWAHRPVVIGWTDSAHSDLLHSQPSTVLGVTRNAWFGVDTGARQVAAIQPAVVAFNAADHLPLTGRFSWKAVLLHELGHVTGLDHPGIGRQPMYPVLPANLTAGRQPHRSEPPRALRRVRGHAPPWLNPRKVATGWPATPTTARGGSRRTATGQPGVRSDAPPDGSAARAARRPVGLRARSAAG